MRDEGKTLTMGIISEKLNALAPEFKNGNRNTVKYWIYRFLHKVGFSFRKKTHKSINFEYSLPFALKLLDHLTYLEKLRIDGVFIDADIINIDEVPLRPFETGHYTW